MENLKFTEKEIDLIITIRNYRRSYPNGDPELLWYLERLFYELLDPEENN